MNSKWENRTTTHVAQLFLSYCYLLGWNMYTISLLPFLVMYASRNIFISSVNIKKSFLLSLQRHIHLFWDLLFMEHSKTKKIIHKQEKKSWNCFPLSKDFIRHLIVFNTFTKEVKCSAFNRVKKRLSQLFLSIYIELSF